LEVVPERKLSKVVISPACACSHADRSEARNLIVLKMRALKDLSVIFCVHSLPKTFEKRPLSVIPTKVGIHNDLKILDSRLHGNDYLDYLW
jgi:hypothetical protein